MLLGLFWLLCLVCKGWRHNSGSFPPSAFLKKLEQCYSVDKGKRTQMHVELHDPNVQVKWLKNGVEIKPSAK